MDENTVTFVVGLILDKMNGENILNIKELGQHLQEVLKGLIFILFVVLLNFVLL